MTTLALRFTVSKWWDYGRFQLYCQPLCMWWHMHETLIFDKLPFDILFINSCDCKWLLQTHFVDHKLQFRMATSIWTLCFFFQLKCLKHNLHSQTNVPKILTKSTFNGFTPSLHHKMKHLTNIDANLTLRGSCPVVVRQTIDKFYNFARGLSNWNLITYESTEVPECGGARFNCETQPTQSEQINFRAVVFISLACLTRDFLGSATWKSMPNEVLCVCYIDCFEDRIRQDILGLVLSLLFFLHIICFAHCTFRMNSPRVVRWEPEKFETWQINKTVAESRMGLRRSSPTVIIELKRPSFFCIGNDVELFDDINQGNANLGEYKLSNSININVYTNRTFSWCNGLYWELKL